MNLIRHGRAVCRPKPRCGECALRRMCPWYRAELEMSAARESTPERGGRKGERGASRPMNKKTFIVFGLVVVVLAA